MITSHKDISVSPCPCRQLAKNLGRGCDHMIDTELSFDFIARYRIDNGFGRRLTREEALEFVKAAEEEALIVSPVNAREQIAMCFCCGCSCYWVKGLKIQDRPRTTSCPPTTRQWMNRSAQSVGPALSGAR